MIEFLKLMAHMASGQAKIEVKRWSNFLKN